MKFKNFIIRESKTELEKGIEIEKEHDGVYDMIDKYLKNKDIEMPFSKEEYHKMIAQVHIDEVPDYYTKLIKYIE